MTTRVASALACCKMRSDVRTVAIAKQAGVPALLTRPLDEDAARF
jgi:hypothetical protein